MAINLLKNIAALQAQRQLDKNGSALSKIYERLSSGMRINQASDDPAGLGLASSINANARVYSQAMRNIGDGVSMLSIAQGAVDELSKITVRIKELAEQAANGVYTSTQRKALNTEAQALRNEYNRIIQSTSYNGRKLLDLSIGRTDIQVGLGASENDRISFALGGYLARAIGDGTFGTAVSYATGSSPLGIASGDLNGDGYTDIISGATGAQNAQVLLGNGNGTFRNGALINTGLQNVAASLVDINGDGKLDLITAGNSVNDISVMLGVGDGTFGAFSQYVAGGDSYTLVVADVNNDGIQDIATTDYTASSLHILLGNSNGTFNASRSFAFVPGQTPLSLRLYDLNNDGNLDAIVTDRNGSDIETMIGNGDGTFRAAQQFTAGVQTYGSAIADYNDDGIPDIVVADSSDNTISYFVGNGDGTFRARVTFNLGAGRTPTSTVAGDFNEDGFSDFAVTNSGDGTLGVFLGNGNGTFKVNIGNSLGSLTYNLTSGDLNGDGVNDLFYSNGNASGSIGVILANTTPGTLIPQFSLLSQAQARDTLSTMSVLQNKISLELSAIGATLSRFTSATNSITVLRENLLAAGSRIMDLDVAEETAELVKKQILQKAGIAIIAQANMQPQLAIDLLKS